MLSIALDRFAFNPNENSSANRLNLPEIGGFCTGTGYGFSAIDCKPIKLLKYLSPKLTTKQQDEIKKLVGDWTEGQKLKLQ